MEQADRRTLTSPTGGLIYDTRHRAGLTMRELAELAGTSPSAIALYESGKRDPLIPTLRRIVEACGMELRMQVVEMTESEQTQRERDNAISEEQAWKNADRARSQVVSIRPYVES